MLGWQYCQCVTNSSLQQEDKVSLSHNSGWSSLWVSRLRGLSVVSVQFRESFPVVHISDSLKILGNTIRVTVARQWDANLPITYGELSCGSYFGALKRL